MYAKSDGAGGWDTEVVTGSAERGNSIAIGPNDRPQIGYFDSSENDVMLAKFNGSGWDLEPVFAPDYTSSAQFICLCNVNHRGQQQPGLFPF